MDNNNNNKAKKINEIRLPATEKESKNETGQKSLNKFPANDNTDKLLSRVTAVHPSDKILTSYLPELIIGSIVNIIPSSSVSPVLGCP